MKGGVILFRGTGCSARRYLESDRSTADEYYLNGGTALAEFAVLDSQGRVTEEGAFSPEQYADWVDWRNPFTGATRGTPRLAAHLDGAPAAERRRLGSPRFAEMVINAPKSLSIAAALHPDVSEALDRAEADAVAEIRSWLAQHSVTRIGPRGAQEIVPVDQLETVTVVHRTSRAGDPHRHIHFQIGTRVYAAGKWRGLDTAALFKQQGAIRALGTAVIAARPGLTHVLAEHGLSLDHVTGEVAELEQYNAVLSKRAAQVEHNLAVLVSAWQDAHPGAEPGPLARARMLAQAWDHERPNKRPTAEGLGCEEGWRRELDAAGYRPLSPPRSLRAVTQARAAAAAGPSADDLSVDQLASRALDRCAAASSTWTIHDIQMHVTHLITENGITATGSEMRDLIALATRLAATDCLSVLPPTVARPEHVAHLTTLTVVAAEQRLRDLIAERLGADEFGGRPATDEAWTVVSRLAAEWGLDADQAEAAALIGSAAPLVIVEGAAGTGKTTMLGAAIHAASSQGRGTRVLSPTRRAAEVAAQELGIPTDSVAALLHARGWRWNDDGVWTRLRPGEPDPVTGVGYTGVPEHARVRAGERIVVDEAGMLDQDTATALLTLADETGANIALVGDRAQLPAVGRGGVLDIAADLAAAAGQDVHDLTGVHRFTDPAYAALTLDLRNGRHPEQLFDRLHDLGLVRLHESSEEMHEAIAEGARPGDAVTVATNDQARRLNTAIREQRVIRGEITGDRVAEGADGLPIAIGDLVMTRRNDNTLGVANRQTWIVQHADNGSLWVIPVIPANGAGHHRSRRLPASYVSDHVHLAYASTAYGVQGDTAEGAHALLNGESSDGFGMAGLDAAGVYVALTRGRTANLLHIVATDLDDAREQFATAMERDRADRGLAHATQHARGAVAGLIPTPTTDLDRDSFAAERARLTADSDRASVEATHWERALATLASLIHEHDRARAPYTQAVATAQAHEESIRADVHASLLHQAVADARTLAEAHDAARASADAARRAGPLSRRATRREAEARQVNLDSLLSQTTARWGSAPLPGSDRTRWARHVAGVATDDHPEVLSARTATRVANDQLTRIDADGLARHTIARQQLLGNRRPSDVQRHAKRLRQRATDIKRLLDRLDAMAPAEAASYLKTVRETGVEGVGVGPTTQMATTKRPSVRAGQPLGLCITRSPEREQDWGPSL